MLHAVLACWPVYLMLFVHRFGQMVAVTLATRTRGVLDHRIPDELPLTAGQWLARRLAALRLPVTSLVTDKQDAAYRPHDRVIQLGADTHYKPDPVYWATAAHELGHARIWFEHVWIAHLRSLAGYLTRPLIAAGTALVVGHVLYGIGSGYAFACLAIAAAAQAFVLVDEAAASVLAIRELRAADAIDLADLRAARRYLIAAFLTYLITYAGYAVLLTQWSIVDGLHTPPTPHELTTVGWIVAIVLVGCCVLFAVCRLVEMFAPGELRDQPHLAMLAAHTRVALVPLLWLAWDLRTDPLYTWCVIAAIAVCAGAWRAIADLAMIPPTIAAQSLLKRFEGPGIEQSARYRKNRRNDSAEITSGNRQLEAIANHWRDNPHWSHRVAALAVLGMLPLLIAIWM